ncbi:hypothetical protein LTR20_006846 [Exophiala xenobiotica]|nr:hypothetical protein LTR79_009698 [Exophiala xenobiotica]KAK5411850.1 hypothetical protein LTR90_007411 [Exophiala xenobiotica]KAK5460421.1 hypothetical protein LTR20_006846 [Exophiala xenobiotica]KAK5481105.1 hypothetical protein LTR26_006940 [Exophiala xenobiotica]KAK5488663.1 hypothetical protein LTR83_007417 [Exophiala xenobiotica]
MTLPQLWKRVVLRSHSTIHYRGDVPEGFGSASPFSMGLNALVTRNVSSLVRSLVLEGDYRSADLEEYSRAGRVSESTMILNIAVRAAVDQCLHLEDFRWDLNVRIQPNVYAGLSKLTKLESLWIRFQTNRSPQPSGEIPALPNLKSFTFTHYDPMCYPDEVSTLLLHADKLESLIMHFSPRMREQGEPSVVLSRFFRKNIAAQKKLHLKKVGVYNLLANSESVECMQAMDSTTMKEFTALNTFGMDEDELHRSTTLFIDRTWFVPMPKDLHQPRSMRLDQLHKTHAWEIGRCAGLEKLYLVNARHKPAGTNGSSSPNSAAASPRTINGESRSAPNTPMPVGAPKMGLRDLYLDSICNVCGPTLKHLILPARWPLSTQLTAKLIRSCPNLTQLSASIECGDKGFLRMLVPFLSQLWAIRVLPPKQCGEEGEQLLATFNAFVEQPDCATVEALNTSFTQRGPAGAVPDFPALKYVGLGHKVWEIGGVYEEKVKTPVRNLNPGESHSGTDSWQEEVVYRRRIRRIEESDVADVEIWKMDSMDII